MTDVTIQPFNPEPLDPGTPLPAPNPYLDTLKAAPLATGAAPMAPTNPYLGELQSVEDARRQQMAATAARAITVNPDKYATQKRVASYLGYPVAAVEALPAQTEREAKVKEIQQNTADSPALQQRFTDEDFARLAHDDTGLLSVLSNSFKRGWPGLKEVVPGAAFRASANALKNFEEIETKLANGQTVLDMDDPMALRYMTPQQRLQLKDRLLAGTGQAATEIALLETEKRKFPLPEVAGNVAQAKTFREAVGAFLEDPVKYIAAIGPESLVQNAPGLLAGGPARKLGGTALGAATMGANSFVTDYNSSLLEGLSKAGVDISDAKALAAAAKDTKLMQTVAAQAFAHATVVGAVDTISAGVASKVVLSNKTLAATPFTREAANMALQTPVQGALGGLGELGGEIAAGQEISPGNILAEIVGEGFGAPAEVATMVGGHFRERAAQARAAVDAERMQDIFKTAAESKLRERSPETFQSLIQDLANETPNAPKEVRFDARTLVETLQQAGVDEVGIAQFLPSVLPQLQEALAAGGEVTVPIGEFTSVVGTEFEQTLLQHARIGDNEFSQAESKAAGEQAAQLLAEQAERVIEQANDSKATRASAESVKTAVLDQLNTAKRFRPDVNEAYATLVRDFYTTTAGRLGITPDELYARYPLKVQAESPATKGEVLNTDALDQPAYHGTHQRGIEQFTTQKIGTGEGAQAYGWGMYFAQSKDIAEFYREAITQAKGVRQGQTYQVEVPEDSDLLDYDAKLKDQPEKVRAALEKAGVPTEQVEVRSNADGKVLGTFPTMGAARRAITSKNMDGKPKTVPNVSTGKDVYEALSKKLGSDEAASRALNDAGIPGLRFLDAGSRGAQAKGKSHNYVIFDDSAVRKTGELYQSVSTRLLEQGPRGTYNPRTLTITLLQKADLSTFLHETGHFFLEVMADVASQPNAPAGMVSDMDAVLKWFGVKDLDTWRGMTLEQQRKHHEKFAESFEQYLLEGKAPSAELQPLFQRFRAWLTNVYRSLSEFMAGRNLQLSDEVRSVFDRLLASEEQIKQAEALRSYAPMFENAEQAGMTAQEWANYQMQGQKATATALDELAARSIKDMRWTTNARSKALKALQKDAATKRKAVEKEVAAEVAQEPVYQAQRWLRKGEMTTAEGEEIKAEKGFRLNTAALAEMYPDSMLSRPDLEKLKGMTAANGLHPDMVAEMFGYDSGDALVRAIIEAEPMASVVEGKTDQRMLERFGDLATEQGIARAADEAVHNEARGRFVATELKALQKANGATERTPGGGSVNVMVRAAKNFASELVARRKVRDLKAGQHAQAETRAGRAAEAALRKGKTQEAIVAKRDELLNHYAARETYRALSEVDKALTYLGKFEKDSTRKKLPPEYLDQIDKLLERVDLRRGTTLAALDKRAKLAEWIKSQEELGIEPTIPDNLREDAQLTSYKEMTLETFRGLVDTIKQIEHLGRLKNKLLTAKDQREFDAIKDSIVQSILDNAGDRTADTRTPTTNLGRALQGIKQFGAAHIKAATWARILDGGKDGGPMWEYFVRSANERGDQETTMRAKATKDLSEIMAPLLNAGKLGGKGVFFPSINRSLNRESVLSIALNIGNEGNLQRLLGGEGWTPAQLKPVLDTLSKDDWAAVQKVWDYFETFRPLIAEKEKRVFGKEPDWVEPGSPLADAYGLKGGYYPIKYDPAASVRAEEHADAEGAKRQLQGAYGAATTKRSFTKARAEEVSGRPLLYTLSGVYSGVNDVIHDLAWHEWLIDTNRLLRSKSIDTAIRTKYGPEVVRQFKSWRDAIAEGESGSQEAIDMALGRLRQSVSVAGLGFNVVSALMQPIGITQSITRVGLSWIGKGVMQYVGAPINKAREVNGKSSFMANRSRTRFRELNELRNKVQGQTAFKRLINENAYVLMMRFQQMVDVPTWLGAYEKAVADGQAEERAVSLADQAVIDSQGGGQTKDLAAIERGGPAQKLFTVFYSFMNTALNLGVASKMTPKSRAKFAVDMLMLYAAPAVLGAILKSAITPGGDDDNDPEKWAKKLAGEQLSFLLGLVVLGREFGSAAQMVTGASDHARDYTGPAGVRAIADIYQFTKQVGQGEFDDAFRKAAVNLAGDLFGLPSAQINRSITGIEALAEGDTQNPAAVVLGYQKPR